MFTHTSFLTTQEKFISFLEDIAAEVIINAANRHTCDLLDEMMIF